MKKTLLILSMIVFLINTIKAQDEVVLTEQNGIKISYKLLLEDKGSKKDKYVLIAKIENIGDVDKYYSVPLEQQDDGTMAISALTNLSFAKISVRNATGMFGGGLTVNGEQTKYITTGNNILFVLKKGIIVNGESKFKVKTGQTPMITNSFTKSLSELKDFNIKIFSNLLNGNYISSCGNFILNISAEKTAENGEHLIQTVNGKQFIWTRKSETTFTRKGCSGFSLTYNKGSKSFTYSTTDGIVCEWKKE